MRIVIIGNAGGGKSILARKLANKKQLRHIEIDRLLWRGDWELVPVEEYESQHAELIAGDDWVIDGLGRESSIADRIARATDIILIDMPLWMHFWLAAERQIEWATGRLEHPPGSITQMPLTHALFRTIWDVDQGWMPKVRRLCNEATAGSKNVTRLVSVDELDAFARTL
jgi:adenylate kinase family enzyme